MEPIKSIFNELSLYQLWIRDKQNRLAKVGLNKKILDE